MAEKLVTSRSLARQAVKRTHDLINTITSNASVTESSDESQNEDPLEIAYHDVEAVMSQSGHGDDSDVADSEVGSNELGDCDELGDDGMFDIEFDYDGMLAGVAEVVDIIDSSDSENEEEKESIEIKEQLRQ